MTKENEELRKAVKGVEVMAQNCLASQPEDDDKCYEHLFKGLSDIFGLAAQVLVKELKRVYRHPQQTLKGKVLKCERCGKEIDEEEYCINFGWCKNCLNNDLAEYHRKKQEENKH